MRAGSGVLPPPAEVQAVFDRVPEGPRKRLMQLRALILAAAEASAVGPLQECLKWGEPAYLPVRPRVGTTLRLGWKAERAEVCSAYVNCNTDLVDRYRMQFPEEFTFHGARELRLPATGAFSEAAFQQAAAMALTYHRDKRAR